MSHPPNGLNVFQVASSAEKLRGRYYTPAPLVRLVLERLGLQPGDVVLDPACGDGAFLVEAARMLVGRGDGARALAARLLGLEVDPAAAAAARERLRAVLREFGAEVGAEELRIRETSALECGREDLRLPEGRLVVAGNPPYVEAKRLPAAVKSRLRRIHPAAAAGAPDLYLYFLHVCLDWLRREDRLALVLPNKVLVGSNGTALRARLLDERRLRGVDFATRAGLFPGAAVYPIVLYAGAAGAGCDPLDLARVAREQGGIVRLPLLPMPAGLYGLTGSRAFFPSPDDPAGTGSPGAALQRMLRSLPGGRLGDVLDVRWAVSVHRRGLRERFVTREPAGLLRARRFLGGGAFSGNGEVRRYRLSWGGWWIDYDGETLRAEGNPLPHEGLFFRPKVVICQNGRTLRAAWDPGRYALKDTFLCGLPRAAPHAPARRPRALIGLLCSRAVHFYYSHVFHGGHVNDGYLHFLRSFLADVPLGAWTEAAAAEVETLVALREQEDAPGEQARLEEAIEEHVGAALGLTSAEREAVRAWCEADRNWQRRERVRPPS
jgi:hypothetical protein